MVIHPTWETMGTNVINQLVGAIVELSTIVKIRKYKGLHEGAPFYSNGHGGAWHTQA
jgi:hypothetical protein